jgi:tetratricopeptide (TPR) repeat protein
LAIVAALRMYAFESWKAGFDLSVLKGHQFLEHESRPQPAALFARYLGFLFYPWPHAPFRPMRLQPDSLQATLWMVTGILAALSCAVGWLWFGRRSGYILGGVGLLLFGFLPVLNVSAIGQFPFEERFLYLPSAGFALVVAGALFARPRGNAHPALAGPIVVLFTALALGNAASAYLPQKHWRDDQHFFRWATEVAPNAMTSWIGLGDLMLQAAQAAPDMRTRVEYAGHAERAFTQSLDIDAAEWFVVSTDREQGNNGLAAALLLQGDLQTAENMLRQIIERFPSSIEARMNLAMAISGQAYDLMGRGLREPAEARFRDAITQYQVVLNVSPNDTAALQGKASMHGYLEEFSTALPLLQRAISIDPDNFGFVYDLAAVQMALGSHHEASQALERFLAAHPQHPQRAEIEATIQNLDRLGMGD